MLVETIQKTKSWKLFVPRFAVCDGHIHESLRVIRRRRTLKKIKDIFSHVTHITTRTIVHILMAVQRWCVVLDVHNDVDEFKKMTTAHSLVVSMLKLGLWQRIIQRHVGGHFVSAKNP